MNQREKMLGGLVVGLVALYGGSKLYSRFQQAVEFRTAEVEAAKDRLVEAEGTVTLGERAVRNLQGWQQRALPKDREQALSLYKAWLLEKAAKAGLSVDDINPAIARATNSQAYNAIGYQMKASGSLMEVIALLHEFYRSPQLHQVTRLQLMRAPGASELSVLMDVEALSLPRAVATDSLPEGNSNRLKLASLDEYKKVFGERDLNAAYKPPAPPREARAERPTPPPPPKFDDAEEAHFTATVNNGREWQAWIDVRTAGEMLRVVAGDPVKIGAFEGEVVSVDPLALVLKTGDKKIRVPLGESLRSGTEIKDDAALNEATIDAPKS